MGSCMCELQLWYHTRDALLIMLHPLQTLDAFIPRIVWFTRVTVLTCIGSGSNLQALNTVGYIPDYAVKGTSERLGLFRLTRDRIWSLAIDELGHMQGDWVQRLR